MVVGSCGDQFCLGDRIFFRNPCIVFNNMNFFSVNFLIFLFEKRDGHRELPLSSLILQFQSIKMPSGLWPVFRFSRKVLRVLEHPQEDPESPLSNSHWQQWADNSRYWNILHILLQPPKVTLHQGVTQMMAQLDTLQHGVEVVGSFQKIKHRASFLPVFVTIAKLDWDYGLFLQHRLTLVHLTVLFCFCFCFYFSALTHTLLHRVLHSRVRRQQVNPHADGENTFQSLIPNASLFLQGSAGGFCSVQVVPSCLHAKPWLVHFQRKQWGWIALRIYFNTGFLPGLCGAKAAFTVETTGVTKKRGAAAVEGMNPFTSLFARSNINPYRAEALSSGIW